MNYLIACGTLTLLLLNGCATYDGPSQKHVRFPDNQPSSSQYPDERAPESGRVIAGNRVIRSEDTTNPDDELDDREDGYSRDASRSDGPQRRQAPSTYNRPRPASAAPATNVAVSGALGSLVSQAQDAYRAGNYQTAISTAERGLRIDRRAPALYLVLAQSYLALNQTAQAAQFANQGLRFSQSGSAEARALEKVRNGAGG
ncbi:MAG TPA: tetratricopeptide repeat protein [Cellvibrionaceae bacterium]